MGDYDLGSTPTAGILFLPNQPTSSTQPGILPWVGAISTSQWAVMLCNCGVKVSMAYV